MGNSLLLKTMLNTSFIHLYFLKISDTVEHPKLWALITTISVLFTQYVFSQWSFAIGFFIIFILDTISGSYVAWRMKNFEGKIFRAKLMDKSLAYFTIIISFSVGTKIVLHESDINLIKYLNLPFYSLFITVELRSIVWKWYEFKKWPWLGSLLELFDKDKKKEIDNVTDHPIQHYPSNESNQKHTLTDQDEVRH
jgi:hypothetical protein